MQPSERQWQDFYALMRRASGLDLAHYKPAQLQRRILGMLDLKKCSDLGEFGAWIRKDEANLRWFTDKLAINVSELFRNPEKWVELEKTVLPDLIKRNKNLKIWSAGCSYGAEAHSMAMVLDAKFPGNHSILGTDIDRDALAQANRGEFSESDVRSIPAEYRSRYIRQAGNSFLADQRIKKYLEFRQQNLLADRFSRDFDLIMCRNVVIYFTDEAKDALYEKFFEALRPGGILFVGSTERIFKSREIGFETAWPFFYRKPLLGDQQWRNAS